jgi:hypothetical protein
MGLEMDSAIVYPVKELRNEHVVSYSFFPLSCLALSSEELGSRVRVLISRCQKTLSRVIRKKTEQPTCPEKTVSYYIIPLSSAFLFTLLSKAPIFPVILTKINPVTDEQLHSPWLHQPSTKWVSKFVYRIFAVKDEIRSRRPELVSRFQVKLAAALVRKSII